MDKSVKINISGSLFQIDEDAYRLLRDYLQSLNNRFKNVPGGHETIDDIESRIAEIFLSMSGTAGVITSDNVKSMIGIIGEPGDFEVNEEPTEFNTTKTSRRRLYRNPDERIISGICGGIGSYLNIDPVWIRLIFILFTITFGIGFFLYIVLWISLPVAYTESQKRELYGDDPRHDSRRNMQTNEFRASGDYQVNSDPARNVGNAINEVFLAIGKFFYIVFRIFAIAFGIIFVALGFTSMLAFLLILFVKNQGFLPAEIHGNFFYLPDFMNFIINPAFTPWVVVLISIAVLLPLLALIYWGIKMIFWFRSRDGIISLVAFVIWVLSLTALAIILSGQGLNFSETGRNLTSIVLANPPDTIYVVTDKKIKDLSYNREVSFPENSYSVYANTVSLDLWIRTKISIKTSEEKSARIEIARRSAGSTRLEANRRAESLLYDYRLSRDTLYLDEYFTIPKNHKWSGDEVRATLSLPAGTIVWFDKTSGQLFDDYHFNNDESQGWDRGNSYWEVTSDGVIKTRDSKSLK